jgi:hypothetical protein
MKGHAATSPGGADNPRSQRMAAELAHPTVTLIAFRPALTRWIERRFRRLLQFRRGA